MNFGFRKVLRDRKLLYRWVEELKEELGDEYTESGVYEKIGEELGATETSLENFRREGKIASRTKYI